MNRIRRRPAPRTDSGSASPKTVSQTIRRANVAAPSGDQYEIRHGVQLVVIAEVDAGLRSYMLGERRVLDGYGPEEMCTGARGQSMIPWPNRIRGGTYTWAGKESQLDLSELEKLGAIHGLTRWAPWRYLEGSAHSAAFGHVLHACPGWGWVLDCRLRYTLDTDGLTVCTRATNRSGTACPYATGAHPYLSVPTPMIDTADCQVPGAVYLPVDAAGFPTGRRLVDGTSYDLREPQSLGDRHIDVWRIPSFGAKSMAGPRSGSLTVRDRPSLSGSATPILMRRSSPATHSPKRTGGVPVWVGSR
ncbi:aldose epimerase family protein [Streptomyces anandii]